jgi:hypothetical protein
LKFSESFIPENNLSASDNLRWLLLILKSELKLISKVFSSAVKL